jgi:carboxyl-terminal processing protease
MRGEEDEPRTFKVTRAIIEIPTLESKNLSGGITHIKLFNFGATASEAFAKSIQAFAKSNNKYLILDLRGNPGGYMESAIDIASWFLPKGTPVLIEERGQGAKKKIYPSVGHDLFTVKPKMVILIDEGSASASEIVAGALSENGIAKLVGEQTFGKGSVQELFPITKDTSLKLTIAKWLTPHGVSISKQGLKPDYEVKLATSTDSSTDPQLAKAIQVVKNLK